MEELKKYAPYLIGCEFKLFWLHADGNLEYDRNAVLGAVVKETNKTYPLIFYIGNDIFTYSYEAAKPILKPLLSLTMKICVFFTKICAKF